MLNFIFKEKTENYKKQMRPLEDLETYQIRTQETIILINGNNEISLSFTFDIYYVWDYFYHLRHFNFKINCIDDLKPYVKNFIENNYFDKSVFDDYP